LRPCVRIIRLRGRRSGRGGTSVLRRQRPLPTSMLPTCPHATCEHANMSEARTANPYTHLIWKPKHCALVLNRKPKYVECYIFESLTQSKKNLSKLLGISRGPRPAAAACCPLPSCQGAKVERCRGVGAFKLTPAYTVKLAPCTNTRLSCRPRKFGIPGERARY
jgi:hypothetical protein